MDCRVLQRSARSPRNDVTNRRSPQAVTPYLIIAKNKEKQMIIILPLNGTPAEHFEDYNELFDCIIGHKNLKLAAKYPDDAQMDWSFTIYPSTEVVVLYADNQAPCAAIEEAFEDNLPLIEICAGDYKKPLYIVLTPNVDMDFLKKKWCTDYCTFYNLVVKEL